MSSNSSEKSTRKSPQSNVLQYADEHSSQVNRDCANASSLQQISIIENMTTFLEANGGAEVDSVVLRNMAKALSNNMSVTSPGTLQDVTMENSYGVGYRSPCVSLQQYQGSTSPAAQGRSVREFEEQMATLRKENFNLKLRLYFIEESIPGYQQANSSDGQATLMQQLIDSKVEMEILRKEIQEKQEILKDAAQAMTQMEKIQKETEAKSQAMVDELKQKLHYLEMERDMEKSNNGELMNDLLGRSDISENFNALQRIRELEGIAKQSEDKIVEFQNQITKLDEILAKRDETIKEYEEKVKELVFQNAELLEALESKEKEITNAERLQAELQQHRTDLADKTCMLQEAEEQLKNREQVHEHACRTIQKLMFNIKNQQLEIERLKNVQSMQGTSLTAANNENASGSNNSANAEECASLCRSMSDSEALHELSAGHKHKLQTKIEEQEATIRALKAEVKKKTANLQNLVNKELWEKNREIERLTQLISKSSTGGLLSPNTTSDSGNELQQSFSDVEYAKAVARNKLLQRKVDVLIQRIGEDRKNESLITQLRNELQEARAEAESSEKWRHECADVCAVLSNRLEELASFLNSLLKHKDVLGVLAIDRRRAIRRAVDRSLDLSKSLNMSLSFSGLSIGEQSFAQLSNLSGILGSAGAENTTFNSHEELRAQQSIETLKAENKALKRELDKRRGVDCKKDRRSLPLTALEHHSESEAWSEPDRKVSLARMGLEDLSASVTKEQLPQQVDTDSESADGELNQSHNSKTRTQERITQLEQVIAQRDDRILQIQCQLVEADNRLKKENLRVLDMTRDLEQLHKRNDELEADLIAIGAPSHSNDELLILRHQIEDKSRSLEKLQEERERLAVEARLAEMHVATIKTDMEELKVKHETALKQAAEQERAKLEQLQKDLNALTEQRLNQQERLHQDTLAREWIARSLYEETKQQLVELQRQHIEAQRTIDYLNENEQELKRTLVESELAARGLKKQLDENTLHASRAVLERTKAHNDKLQMEKRVEEIMQQLNELKAERNSLQCRVRHLESLVKLQQQQQQQHNVEKEVSQSGYTSEEVPVSAPQSDDVTTSNGANSAVSDGIQRANNSSPDLGIESDAGRVSSVELSNAQHAQLKTVELTNAANNNCINQEPAKGSSVKTTTINNSAGASANAGGPPHDCAKVDQENAELRRKLIRTKRAFEDTYEKLRGANQRKAQLEKDIKNQILKTHNVLKNVRSNMENEL